TRATAASTSGRSSRYWALRSHNGTEGALAVMIRTPFRWRVRNRRILGWWRGGVNTACKCGCGPQAMLLNGPEHSPESAREGRAMSLRRWPIRSVAAFCAGLLLAVALPLAAGELYLRAFPPEDFRLYLGESSPLTGPFRPDPAFGAQYRSWEAFKSDYHDRVWPYLPYIEGPSKPPCWAMFANSIVQ